MGTNKCVRQDDLCCLPTNMPKHLHSNISETALGFYRHRLQPVNQFSRSASQEILCTGSNISGAALPHVPSSSTSQTQADTPGSFTPTLAAHFDENLIRHIQGWPSENTEKQVLCTTDTLTCYRAAYHWSLRLWHFSGNMGAECWWFVPFMRMHKHTHHRVHLDHFCDNWATPSAEEGHWLKALELSSRQ